MGDVPKFTQNSRYENDAEELNDKCFQRKIKILTDFVDGGEKVVFKWGSGGFESDNPAAFPIPTIPVKRDLRLWLSLSR